MDARRVIIVGWHCGILVMWESYQVRQGIRQHLAQELERDVFGRYARDLRWDRRLQIHHWSKQGKRITHLGSWFVRLGFKHHGPTRIIQCSSNTIPEATWLTLVFWAETPYEWTSPNTWTAMLSGWNCVRKENKWFASEQWPPLDLWKLQSRKAYA